MAPPTKASSHTSKDTRQSSRKSRKHSDEQHSDSHASADVDSMDIDSEERDQPSTASAQELIANMVEGQRKRHLGKKRSVVKAYDAAAKNVEESIDNMFNAHEEEASSAHEAQLKRLKDLLTMKANLEADMEEKLTALKADYEAHSHDVQLVLTHKLKELK